MTFTSGTEAAAVIEKVVSAIVQETLIQESVIIPLVWNKTAEIRPGMDTLDIPRFVAPNVETVTEGSAVTEHTQTIAIDQLVMNINEAITWAVSDRTSVQSKINIVSQITRDGARAMAAKVDDAIIVQLLRTSTATPDHTVQYAGGGAAFLAQTDILEARRLLSVYLLK